MYFYDDNPEGEPIEPVEQKEHEVDPITQGVIEAINEERQSEENQEKEKQAEQSQRKEEKEDRSSDEAKEDSPVGNPGEKQKPPLGNQEGGPKPDTPGVWLFQNVRISCFAETKRGCFPMSCRVRLDNKKHTSFHKIHLPLWFSFFTFHSMLQVHCQCHFKPKISIKIQVNSKS